MLGRLLVADSLTASWVEVRLEVRIPAGSSHWLEGSLARFASCNDNHVMTSASHLSVFHLRDSLS